ncbi:MAG: glycosyltransferase [Spirochaetes bacterium GWD1_27_9]|nr:MAG: glycosyltransferase [Spirochaetes bacterium GWB1_27_13]OHD24995.1 MAG: glycosyltransferase [Spirochaetes bacterium GWC1_27_15]OHD43444.1 MAG: glycosyltransferase [Spirochaetes bacterium GWD1_27_9]
MRIAIAIVQVPFMSGGAEIHANLLRNELKKRGHQAEIVWFPFKWYPTESLVNSMIMARMFDLSESNGEKIDMVIGMKFPAFYVKHENKVLWILHQYRQVYDFWGTMYGDQNSPDGEFIKNTVIKNDNLYIPEAKRIFTNSKNTANRLKKYNDIDGIALYHPPQNYEKLCCRGYENFVFYPSRIEEVKRQRILVESAKYIKNDIKVYIAGIGPEKEMNYLKNMIKENNLEDKVKLLGFISEEEKIDYYARSLAIYFGAYDEDYGYITLESFFSKKPIIVHTDAGGPLEFVEDGKNGFVTPPDAKLVAQKIDWFYENKDTAIKMGEEGYKLMIDKNINWDFVIDSLLGKT